MKRTGVFATEEEVKRIVETARLPVIKVGDVPPRSILEIVHEYALNHGLPEIEGYYGIDCSNREFCAP